MSKRDYYEVLGVDRTASAEEIKKPIVKLLLKTTPTETLTTKKPKPVSKKPQKPTTFCAMKKNEPIMTDLDTVILAIILAASPMKIFSPSLGIFFENLFGFGGGASVPKTDQPWAMIYAII